jgi:leucyl-tRNA synthetase
MSSYDFAKIESKWQRTWESNRTFRSQVPGEEGFDPSRPKFYVLDMFPYPSGVGLHVGHPLGYIATDIVARHKRMRGFNVMHPMGFDAFGLPAEQYAIETGTHPEVTTNKNIENMRRQLRMLGLSYDWDRELATTDPGYYRWTQWIFLRLFHSWFDPEAGRARPIADLVASLEADEARVGPEHEWVRAGGEGFAEARRWADLDTADREAFYGRHRLAYVAQVPVNWCPELGTVLANEEVTNEGRSERGNYPVFRRPLKQWMLRITAYADRLLEELDDVDWPEPVKKLQRNWIGRSEGARVVFPVRGHDETIEVFTTRPDTLFGATYMVLAPEHPLVEALATDEQREAVDAYRVQAAAKSELDRQADAKAKDGVFTGVFAVNPTTGEDIPIWIADYVLMGYGTGAIMAVPGHDHRDFEFARTFDLPVRVVVDPPDAWFDELREAGMIGDEPAHAARASYLANPAGFPEAFTGEGAGVNSANDEVSLDGRPTPDAKRTITAWLESKEIGRGEIQYKLRDWLFSRQRYWGEPFPILHGPEGELVAVPDEDLPVELPPLTDFRPRGSEDPEAPPQPSLSRAEASWRIVEMDGKTYERELNTMPQWAGSCWYYLRFLDPKNDERMVDAEIERYWMAPNGIDLYVGGVEHAVLHLLYARFWHKVLHDLGHVSTREPFGRLYNQGYIQAFSYQDERGIYVEASAVVEEEDGTFTYEGRPVTRNQGKMGKSLKNSISPDEVVEQYGCDTLRLYEMYMGPVSQSKTWSTRDIVGVHRFLRRLWRNLVDEDTGACRVTDEPASEDLRRLLHRTIAAVSEDMDGIHYNTALARLIELNNALVSLDAVPLEVADPVLRMLAPQAPHIAEELWERMGGEGSVCLAAWPEHDPAYLVVDEVEIAVQVTGKKRAVISVPVDAAEEDVVAIAKADENVARHLEGKTVRKVIYVPGRLLNIVAT